MPALEEQELLDQLQARLLESSEIPRFNQLLDEHHYLGSHQPFGERL